MMRLVLGIWIAMALLPVPGAGQDTHAERGRYLSLSSGWNYTVSRDRALSPMIYRGSGTLLRLGYASRNERAQQSMNLAFHYGRLRQRQSPLGARILLLRADIDYRRVYRVARNLSGHYHFFFGGGFLTAAVYRQHNAFSNNAYQYDDAHSLSLESGIQRYFSLRQRSLRIRWYLSLPLVSAVFRPGYNSSIPDGFVEEWGNTGRSVLASVQWVGPRSYQRVISRWSLGYALLNGNELEIGYDWELYHYSFEHPLTTATHRLRFTLMFQLSRPS